VIRQDCSCCQYPVVYVHRMDMVLWHVYGTAEPVGPGHSARGASAPGTTSFAGVRRLLGPGGAPPPATRMQSSSSKHDGANLLKLIKQPML
jgi:hypothetical protein